MGFGKISITNGGYSTALGILGTGLQLVLPTQFIGWSFIGLAGALLLWSIRINERHVWERWWGPKTVSPHENSPQSDRADIEIGEVGDALVHDNESTSGRPFLKTEKAGNMIIKGNRIGKP